MRQRALIAIALACQPRLLIADEPTTALDVTIQAQILELLRELVRETGAALIMITHDLGVVAGLCDMVNVLYGGRIVERAQRNRLFGTPRHPYTHGLLRSIPRLDAPAGEPLEAIPGSVVDNLPWAEACAFAPRCPREIERCTDMTPGVENVGGRLLRCHNPVPQRGVTHRADPCWTSATSPCTSRSARSRDRPHGGPVYAVDGVSLTIDRGETTGGRDRPRKSTLGGPSCGCSRPPRQVLFARTARTAGRGLRRLRRRLQLVFRTRCPA